MTLISDGNTLSQHWYQLIEAVGYYESVRTKQPGGVGTISFLKLNSNDGAVYVDLFDRAEDEAKRFEGKLVRVAGQIQPPLDESRPLQVAARDNLPALVSISSIQLASG